MYLSRLNGSLLLGFTLTCSWLAPHSNADDLAPLATLSSTGNGDALEGITALALVPSAAGTEPRLATVGADKILRLWSWRTGKLLQSWSDVPAPALVRQLLASSDGKTLVASWDSGTGFGDGKPRVTGVRIWSLADGQSKVVAAPTAGFERLAFWPDSQTLAVQGRQKITLNPETLILLYDVSSGALKKSLLNHYPLAFDGKNGALLEPYYNRRSSRELPGLARWNVVTGDLEATLLPFTNDQKMRGTMPRLGRADLSPDATRLVVQISDNTEVSRKLQIFETASLRPSWTLYPPMSDSMSSFSSVEFAGRLLLTQSANAGFTVWDSGGGDLLATLPANSYVTATSPDGRFLALLPLANKTSGTPSNNGQPTATQTKPPVEVQIWDMSRFKPLNERLIVPVKAGDDGARTLRETDTNLGGVNDAVFSRDGKTLVSSQGSLLVSWDVQSGARLQTHSGTGGVAALAVSPDGRWVLTGSGADNIARLWDGRKLSLLRDLGQHDWGMNTVTFSPDSRLALAAGSGLTGETGRSSKGVISVWEAATGKKLKTLVNSSDRVQSLAFSPDGKLLANGNFRSGIDIWNVATFLADPDPFGGKPDYALEARGTTHNALAFSSDGKTLFAATPEGQVEVFDVATKKSLRFWETGDGTRSRALALSPDGKKLATVAGPDAYPKPTTVVGTVKIWDVATGKLLRTIQIPGVSARSAAWKTTPAGATLAIGLADGSIKLWSMD